MRYRCKDCGTPNYTPSERADICTDCMELRGKFMSAWSAGNISHTTFLATQHAMNYGRWRAADAMKEALELSAPPAEPSAQPREGKGNE